MIQMNSILEADLKEIVQSPIVDWNELKNKTIFITGATGLIGSILIRAILLKNRTENSNIKLILLVRNKEDAEKLFGQDRNISYIVSSIDEYIPSNIDIDYIIHGASPTKSKYFIENPVETIDIAVIGTKKILEQAKMGNIKSMVYLSSMEMYGTMNSNNVEENEQGYIDPLSVRSSYSQGKRMCELYCYSYYNEYNVPVKMARIAQTFGAGISKNENRVYKNFADAVINKKDIVLKSEGTTIINYSYTTDTVIGLLCILLNGKNGDAYNLVSDNINMTILDSAKYLAEKYGNGMVNVKIEIPEQNQGFAPNNRMILNNEKLKSIGWNYKYDLKQGYDRLIKYLKEE